MSRLPWSAAVSREASSKLWEAWSRALGSLESDQNDEESGQNDEESGQNRPRTHVKRLGSLPFPSRKWSTLPVILSLFVTFLMILEVRRGPGGKVPSKETFAIMTLNSVTFSSRTRLPADL